MVAAALVVVLVAVLALRRLVVARVVAGLVLCRRLRVEQSVTTATTVSVVRHVTISLPWLVSIAFVVRTGREGETSRKKSDYPIPMGRRVRCLNPQVVPLKVS